MRVLNNKNVKILILACIIISIICTISIVSSTNSFNDYYKKEVNYIISQIIGTVKEKYPDVDEDEIIEILNNKSVLEEKNYSNILERYSIDDSEFAILSVKQYRDKMILKNIVILTVCFVSIICIIYIYLKKRQKRIDELCGYIDKILNRVYSLEIEENCEDELSSLKNQLYKITVMLKEQASYSIKQKEELANSVSDISHQLKTPLTSILILLDNLYDNENMEPQIRKKFILEITHQIEAMNWLIISLLKLSKLDANVVEFANEDINVHFLIEEVLKELEIMAEVKDVRFIVNADDSVILYGDFNWNKEAVKNIVKNAIEHSSNNSEVCIDVTQNDVFTEIDVKDTGEGIDENDLKHIFDRFYKAKNSSENSIGIGLALAKSIVDKQNGTILIDSNKDKGSVFKIRYLK